MLSNLAIFVMKFKLPCKPMVEIHPYREDVGSIHRPETTKLANGEVTIIDHSGYPYFCWLNPQSTTLCSHLDIYIYMCVCVDVCMCICMGKHKISIYIYRVGGIPGTDHQDPCIACTVLQHLMQED